MIIQGWMGARKARAGQVLTVVQLCAQCDPLEEWCLFLIFVILDPFHSTGCPGVTVMFSGLDSVRAAHSPHCSSLPRYLLATHSVPEANDTASDKTEGH